ncbi:pyridoxamine 5'-phosphate oxidase [Intrasporangium oryzae NRRL B-24470]|uniref:Pyridoxamine 5'-phosphate oxidase n=1 Tax=Intrasporangium oryzae NRRL B-24470 TaxID=1386089 RepID=W9GEL7_9MICO|nr:pyridoxamine 5'-phosphate oxidase family protein [Intrasporangium oryzae]EWT02324.1 pyridoxamine 5'-phosphate oxidase [Intrasporangium oryzae NRRL B-24470]
MSDQSEHYEQPEQPDPVHVLHPTECWEFLRDREFGRLAFHLVGEVHITPINYAVDRERILFLTSEGNKLLGVTMNEDVAFEVDEVGEDTAVSVVARGRARHLEGQERYIVESLPLRPWVDYPKYQVVAITVTEITGRRFDLSRPWLHDRVDPANA